jgi:hypothetical protein
MHLKTLITNVQDCPLNVIIAIDNIKHILFVFLVDSLLLIGITEKFIISFNKQLTEII